MIKRLLFAALLLITCAVSASAYDFMVDGLCYNKNSDGKSVTVTYQNSSSPRYSSLSGDVTIPASVTTDSGETFSVTSIGEDAFFGCSDLTSVTIPNSVTSIGYYAFQNCSGLTSVTWNAKKCWYIAYLDSEQHIVLPFLSCPNIKTFEFGSEVKIIPANLCRGLTGLTSVTIPNSVTIIGDEAFRGCGLTSVTIPNSVTSLGAGAFRGCYRLKSVTWDAKECTVGTAIWDEYIQRDVNVYPFSGCTDIKTFEFGSEVESIPDCLCRGLTGLTSITIPNSVTKIGAGAFYGCRGLTSVTWDAKECTGYYEIWDEYQNTDVTVYPFSNCTNIKTFEFGSEVERIPNDLCHGLTGLTSITIPNSVTEIDDDAFYGCSGLTSVNISDIAKWCAIKFGYYGANPLYYAHHLYLNGSEVTDLIIPNSVIKIGDDAFSGCSGLTSVTIPNSVFKIGNYAFYGCSGLTSVTIGNSVTSIGDYAFRGCTGLTSLTIPNSVFKIGNNTFYNCSGLTSVTIPNSVTSIGGSAFRGCSGLTRIDAYPNPAKVSMGSDVFYNVPKDGTLHVRPKYQRAYQAADQWEEFDNIKADLIYVKGDLSDDESIDGNDVSILLEMALSGGFSAYQLEVADLNNDQSVDGYDVSILLEKALSGD